MTQDATRTAGPPRVRAGAPQGEQGRGRFTGEGLEGCRVTGPHRTSRDGVTPKTK